MKTPLLTLRLLAAPAFAFAQSAEPEPAPAAGAPEQQAATLDPDAQANLDARRDCLRYTGSLVASSRNDRRARARAAEKTGELRRDDCIAAHGRVYSREDLQRTGEVDIADALRKLDPAIR